MTRTRTAAKTSKIFLMVTLAADATQFKPRRIPVQTRETTKRLVHYKSEDKQCRLRDVAVTHLSILKYSTNDPSNNILSTFVNRIIRCSSDLWVCNAKNPFACFGSWNRTRDGQLRCWLLIVYKNGFSFRNSPR